MKRCGLGCGVLLGMLFLGNFGRAQSSLDMLEKDLNEVKQEHQEATSQNTDNFLKSLETASATADAALNLYQQAGGELPDATEVQTKYEHETPTEKAARLAKDQTNLSNFAGMVQLHCGLMRFAALQIVKPDLSTLHGDWLAWLKNAVLIYPQLTGAHKIKEMTMKDSIISSYLAFQGWGDKDEGGWTVKDLPRFYRRDVLEPLRNPPTAAALPAWDIFIAMKNADEPDPDKWNQVTYPGLAFDRDADDFAIAPSTEKLETMVKFIKANSTHPKADEWIGRVHEMMQAYRAQKAGLPAPASSTPDPNAAPAPAPPTGGPAATTTSTAPPAN